MYSAMRLGTIDGFTWTVGELEAGNLKEVVKDVLSSWLLTPGTHLIINKDRWAELPDDLQTKITGALEDAHLKIAAEYESVDAKAIAAAKAYGVKFPEISAEGLTKLKEASQAFWTEVEGASPASKKMVETYRAFLAEARQLIRRTWVLVSQNHK